MKENTRLRPHWVEHRQAWHAVADVYRKLVPTGLDFSPSLPGGWCYVTIGTWSPTSWSVTVRGGDDCAIQRCFTSFEDALALFNRTTYLETLADLHEFEEDVGFDTNHNGWPHEADIPDGWKVACWTRKEAGRAIR